MLESLLRGASHLGISLTTEQLRQFQLYYQELVAWNRRVNLTAITAYEEVQTRHFLDSLTAIAVIREAPWAAGDFSLIDVGTGGGLPGIPLKIALKQARALLVDSVAKKTAFVQHAIVALGLEHTEVATGRAEALAHQPPHRQGFELALCRAVSRLATDAELTLPFLRTGGLAVIYKKGGIQQELSQAGRAIETLGGRTREVRQIDLEGLEKHCLVILEKVADTPSRFPRRAGVPQKRPIS
ncbi:MAG: 16S rRNA (guanine(527)-N(7))-methyltransferase RsmG [Chloroflexi bacterium]|nr:16S rRNA (guanine(527)-N(7))-methyltransferase RsmG [Chloroflexota bacterium]